MPDVMIRQNRSSLQNIKQQFGMDKRVLQTTLKSGQNRKCRDISGVVLFFVELVIIICLYSVTDLPQVQQLKEKIGLIGVTTDTLGRVCGLDVQPDFNSPRLDEQHVAEMCQLLGFPSECDLAYLKLKLSATGTYAVTGQNESVCVAQISDCHIPLAYQYAVDDVYQRMVNSLRGASYQYSHPSFLTKTEFISDSQLLSDRDATWILRFTHQLPTSSQEDKVIYERYYMVDSLGYKMCQHSYGSSLFGQISNVPRYLYYFSSYFTNFRSLFIYELISYLKYIVYGILASFGLAYIFCLVITLMSRVVIYVAWLLVPLSLIAITVLLAFLFTKQSGSQALQLQMYNFTDYGKNLLVVVLIIAAVILCVGAVFFFMYIIFQKEEINRTSQCIRICAGILKNRIRLYFLPILFMFFLSIHVIVCVFLLLCIVVSGNFDSRINMYTLVDYGADGAQHLNAFKIVTIVLTAIYLVQGLFLIYYMQEYIYGILTTSWYTDRISRNYESIKYLEINFTSPRSLRALEKINAQSAKCYEIDLKLFNTHQGNSYLKAAKHMFFNFGSLFLHSSLAIIFCIPRLILRFLNWLKQDSEYAFVMRANQSKFYAGVSSVVDRGLAITDRQVTFYLQISGENLGTALKNRRCFEQMNTNVIADIKKASVSVYTIGKFISVLGGVVLEQVFEMINDYSTFTANPMRITTVVVCLLFTALNNSFVLHLIDTLNISLIYNYNMDLGVDPKGEKVNHERLPKGIKKFFDQYNLTKLSTKFQIKLIERCFK